MVNLKFHFYYFALKVTSLLSSNLLFFNILSITQVHLFLCLTFACGLVLHFHTGYYALSYIFCAKYFSAFPHIPFSSIVIIPHCNYELFYAITFLIRVTNLNFISISSGVLPKRSMLESFRPVYQIQPLISRRPWQRQKPLPKVDISIFLFRSNHIEFTT